MKNLPKVLIIGETFRNDTGGGITITNLFKNWPKENLSVITQVVNNNYNFCENYYLLGNNEYKYSWPFKYFRKNQESGILNKEIISNEKKGSSFNKNNFVSIIKTLLKKIIGNTSHFFGIHYKLHKLKISDNLLTWLNQIEPELIYVQPNSLAIAELVNELKKVLNIDIAVHIVDDYTGNKNKFSPFYFKYESKIKNEYYNLVQNSRYHLSICDEMSRVYKKRFGKVFTSIHNPVDKKKWSLTTNAQNDNTYKIIYAGRIGIANLTVIMNLIKIVDLLNNDDFSIKFDIYSLDHIPKMEKYIKTKTGTTFMGFVNHSQLPKTMIKYNLLFLPLSLSKKSLRFTKLSMPTKVSEYMMVGKPILVIAPKESALFKYSSEKDWAFTLSTDNEDVIKESIRNLYLNKELNYNLSNKARELALKNHEIEKVTELFEKILTH